jgi:hypothetical protein
MNGNNVEDYVCSQILGDAHLFSLLYNAVKVSCNEALASPSVIESRNKVCVLPANVEYTTRRMRPIYLTCKESIINFNPDHMFIVGGGALNVYSFLTNVSSSIFVKNPTTDMDIVWWPEINPNFYQYIKKSNKLWESNDHSLITTPIENLRNHTDFVVTSMSPLFKHLANAFKDSLSANLNLFLESNGSYILANILKSSQMFAMGANVDLTHTFMAGVYNIKASFNIGDLKLNILDISIHDGASSQKSNNLNYTLRDPMYCNPYDSIRILNFTGYNIPVAVPFFSNFINQQSLALKNRVEAVWEGALVNKKKASAHLARIHYFFHLLKLALQPFHPVGHHILNILGIQYVDLNYMRIVQTLIFNSSHGIAACPWDLKTCGIPTNNEIIMALCRDEKMLNNKLCSGVPRLMETPEYPETVIPPVTIHTTPAQSPTRSPSKPSSPKPSLPKPSSPKPSLPKPSSPKPSLPKPSSPKPSIRKVSRTRRVKSANGLTRKRKFVRNVLNLRRSPKKVRTQVYKKSPKSNFYSTTSTPNSNRFYTPRSTPKSPQNH